MVVTILFFDGEWCYDSGNVLSLDKNEIDYTDVVAGHENDSYNGCVNSLN